MQFLAKTISPNVIYLFIVEVLVWAVTAASLTASPTIFVSEKPGFYLRNLVYLGNEICMTFLRVIDILLIAIGNDNEPGKSKN